jgi:hypothetical protein
MIHDILMKEKTIHEETTKIMKCENRNNLVQTQRQEQSPTKHSKNMAA